MSRTIQTPPPNQGAKRLVDLVIAVVMILVLLPVMAIIALAIALSDGRPVLFRQVRPGLHGQPFTCVKYRTMRAPKPGQNQWTSDEDRVTSVGRFLRKTSLDELPELFNVLGGQMSLVGPRPLLMEYLPLYSTKHRQRHSVRPGITGLAQVSGRRGLTFSQRLDLDVRYIQESSILFDLQILLLTLAEPFRPGDIAGQTLRDVDDLGFHRIDVDRTS